MEEFVCVNKIYGTKNFHFLQQTFIVKTIMVESEFLCRDNLFACPQKGHSKTQILPNWYLSYGHMVASYGSKYLLYHLKFQAVSWPLSNPESNKLSQLTPTDLCFHCKVRICCWYINKANMVLFTNVTRTFPRVNK